jgi:hypothetical protein
MTVFPMRPRLGGYGQCDEVTVGGREADNDVAMGSTNLQA